VYHHTIQIN